MKTVTRCLVREFADMLCHRHGEHLEAWAAKADSARSASYEASPRDCARTGPPSPPDSPSPTAPAPPKATSTAVKMLKRQMYGRASPDLLCMRILLAG